MKAWSKYSQVLNDPVRNLNMRLTFQNGDVTMVRPHHLANVRFQLMPFFLRCLVIILLSGLSSICFVALSCLSSRAIAVSRSPC